MSFGLMCAHACLLNVKINPLSEPLEGQHRPVSLCVCLLAGRESHNPHGYTHKYHYIGCFTCFPARKTAASKYWITEMSYGNNPVTGADKQYS